jgi:hypothetical protein
MATCGIVETYVRREITDQSVITETAFCCKLLLRKLLCLKFDRNTKFKNNLIATRLVDVVIHACTAVYEIRFYDF